ncbi:uncharacterized protein LOC129227704 isoform X2 [Uloborus diversus]|uniref:uncharacterized protein LOC129227704 isoform X2 n=1 Tax=Uloborus diversus TaxID=327109 RepID=UPI0024098CF7|nr:uncharacterized protein LOC129227704 isoform X2 [Uloborus diversus]
MGLTGLSMLALIFILFLAQNGATESGECDRRATEVCPQMKVKLTFPGSAEEINALCPEVIKSLDCLHKHHEMCPEAPGAPLNPEQNEDVNSLIRDICNRDSLLHKVLSKSAGCIKSTVLNMREAIFAPRLQLRQAYIRYRESAGESTELETMPIEEKNRFYCLNHFQDISLMLATVEDKCGTMAKSAVREVVIRSKFLQAQKCTKELVRILQSLVDSLELSTEMRSRMSELMTSFVSWEDN